MLYAGLKPTFPPAVVAGSAQLPLPQAPPQVNPQAPALARHRLYGFPPIAGPATRLLLLGSFPGTASLAAGEYYAHPRNKLWPLLSGIMGVDLLTVSYADRLAQLRERGIGLWDVYASCYRTGSLDSAITLAEANNLTGLAATLPRLEAVAHNGAESARAMRATAALGHPAYRLPSTSPAHASWSFERKLAAWRAVFQRHGLCA